MHEVYNWNSFNSEITQLVGLLTLHCCLRKKTQKIGIHNRPDRCKHCWEYEEISFAKNMQPQLTENKEICKIN